MAVSTTFKQMCPSCEAMVTIKEEKVGKKVECNKCKDKFIAVRPKEEGKSSGTRKKGKAVEDDVDEVEEEEEPVQVKKSKGKATANGKANGKVKHAEDEDEEDEEDDEDEYGKPQKKSKKKEGGASKLTLGLILAGVGVVVLCVAAYFLIFNRPSTKGPSLVGNPNGNPPPLVKDNNKNISNDSGLRPVDSAKQGLTEAELAKLTNLLPNDSEHVLHVFFKDLLSTANPLRDAFFQSPGSLRDDELQTRLGFSLLAIDDLIRAERYSGQGWVFTVIHFKDVLNEAQLRSALKLRAASTPIDGQPYYQMTEPNPSFDALARFSFGIPNQAMLLARRSAGPTFLRIHNSQTLIVGDESPVIAFLRAKGQFPLLSPKGAGAPGTTPAGTPSANTPPAGATPNDPANKPPTPPGPGNVKPGTRRPGMKKGASLGGIKGDLAGRHALDGSGHQFVSTSFSDSEIAPPNPMDDSGPEPGVEFVQTLQNLPDVNPAFRPSPPPTPAPGPNAVPPATPDGAPTPAPASSPRDEMYLTIKPAMKAILDRMELRPPNSQHKLLFSSATDMDANRVATNLPEFKNRVARRPRQLWDVTLMINETKPRIRFLGTALMQRDLMKFQFRNELTCAQEIDAKEFQRELIERTAYNVARFVSKLVDHEILPPSDKAPEPQQPPEPPAPGQVPKVPEKKPDDSTRSKISVTQEGATVDFAMDLVLDNPVIAQLIGIANLSAGTLRAEMEAFAGGLGRHYLAGAAKTLGEKGLSAREIPPGRYPPGAFVRTNIPAGIQREPKNRISWMAGLLPYMGQENLFNRIRFDLSWRDPGNWMAGQTIIPQFLNPAYPDYTRQVSVGDVPVDFGATHYVGMAGVGLDAASYKRGNPATQHKEGVFSNDGAATLDEIRQGRGLENTIVMIEVPYDGITGVSPWSAGGGATLRGVPEKNSVAPFVHSTERGGKTAKGTYAMMANGTVRFIDQNVSDDVFKAMCTVRGPAPENFDPSKDPNTPLVPVPKGQELKFPVSKPSVTTTAPAKEAKTDSAPKAQKSSDPAKHAGAGRTYDQQARLSIALPTGWVKAPSKSPLFLLALGPKDGNFSPNLNVLALPDDGTPIEKVGEGIKAQLKSVNGWSFVSEAFVTIDGRKSYTLSGRMLVNQVEVNNLQYVLMGNNGNVYVLTFSATPTSFASLRKAFEESASSVRID